MRFLLRDSTLENPCDILEPDPFLVVHTLKDHFNVVYEALLDYHLLYLAIHVHKLLKTEPLLIPQHCIQHFGTHHHFVHV
jgi:hypothetical protein